MAYIVSIRENMRFYSMLCLFAILYHMLLVRILWDKGLSNCGVRIVKMDVLDWIGLDGWMDGWLEEWKEGRLYVLHSI